MSGWNSRPERGGERRGEERRREEKRGEGRNPTSNVLLMAKSVHGRSQCLVLSKGGVAQPKFFEMESFPIFLRVFRETFYGGIEPKYLTCTQETS
jgi:hypothetical protein